MSMEKQLAHILENAEEQLQANKLKPEVIAGEIERQFNQLKKSQIEDVKFCSLAYVFRWHTVLKATGLVEDDPHTNVGFFFDMIIDYYSDSAGRSVAG
ncbi:hypothetical protein [Halodesulfovibrio aestuarii]|uniref:Uncharacterized protein n=1 Tax=Halodesulfovibrio aestuarii TaxID=126333 RepID=A0ABV4JMY9_9BACT